MMGLLYHKMELDQHLEVLGPGPKISRPVETCSHGPQISGSIGTCRPIQQVPGPNKSFAGKIRMRCFENVSLSSGYTLSFWFIVCL